MPGCHSAESYMASLCNCVLIAGTREPRKSHPPHHPSAGQTAVPILTVSWTAEITALETQRDQFESLSLDRASIRSSAMAGSAH
ncbi:hypothetical protein VTN49DRAFT_2480 [Thermomyces lanuginosus]|uniref:uncharacterized protein n=1 Tax=Thermomyces lanuginosus TaxID=5541 RepID=UPI003742B60C